MGYTSSTPKYSIRILAKLTILSNRAFIAQVIEPLADGRWMGRIEIRPLKDALKPPKYAAFHGIGRHWTGFEKLREKLITSPIYRTRLFMDLLQPKKLGFK